MTRDEIAKEFDRFFEFDTEDRSTVTSVSARLFAERIAALSVAEEREQCAKVADYCQSALFDSMHDLDCAAAIRARSNK